MKDLDLLMEKAKPGETITLEPGTYTTKGWAEAGDKRGQRLKKGVDLIGAGTGTTVVRFTPPHDNCSFSPLSGEGENSFIHFALDVATEDSAIDLLKNKRNGIFCEGDGNQAIGIDVIRPFGFTRQAAPATATTPARQRESKESFAIMLHGTEKGSLISNCRVLDVKGNYQSGLCLQKGTIKNCGVVFQKNRLTPETYDFFMGYNIGAAKDVVVENCWQVNGSSFFYSDWQNVDGLKVRNNAAFNVDHLVLIKRQFINATDPSWGFFNAEFTDNEVLLNADQPEQVAAFVLDNTREQWSNEPHDMNFIRDIRIERNRVSFPEGTKPKAKYRYFLNLASNVPVATDAKGISRVTFRDNIAPADWKWRNRAGYGKEITRRKSNDQDDPITWIT